MVPEIIAGFDLDCNELFVRFEKLSTVRYAAFAEVWKEMKFSLVFSGRRVKELICFTTEALSYVKFFFMKTNSFLRRICALYIIYGMYYKQPLQYTSKILVTLEEWSKIKDFINELKDNDHMDALIILLTLIFDNAFEFSVTNSVRFTAISCRGMIHTNYLKLSAIDNFDLNSLTDDLNKVEEDYKEIKQKLIASGQLQNINYSSDNMAQQLQEILKRKTTPIKTTNISKPGPSKQKKDNIAEKRKSLREKCFKKKTKSAIYRSSVVKVESENTDSDESL